MRYYIADLHFFHEAMNTHMDKRGFENTLQMNEYMIQRWNQKVRKKDEVVILGDLSWGSVQDTNALLEQLQGKLYLIQQPRPVSETQGSRHLQVCLGKTLCGAVGQQPESSAVPLPHHVL